MIKLKDLIRPKKEKIKDLSIAELYKRYRSSELFEEEIQRRVSENPKEVMDYMNRHQKMFSSDLDLPRFIALFPMYPVEYILSWDVLVDISYAVCEKYLTNDFSWIRNPKIVTKMKTSDFYKIVEKYQILQRSDYVSSVMSYLDYKQIAEVLKTYQTDTHKLIELLSSIPEEILDNNTYSIDLLFQNDLMEDIERLPIELYNRLISIGYIQEKIKQQPAIIKEEIIKANPRNLIQDLTNEDLLEILEVIHTNPISICMENNILYEKLKSHPFFISQKETFLLESKHFDKIKTSAFLYDYVLSNIQNILQSKKNNRILDYIFEDRELFQILFEDDVFVEALILEITGGYLIFSTDKQLQMLPYIHKMIDKIIEKKISFHTFETFSNNHPLLKEEMKKDAAIPGTLLEQCGWSSASKLHFLFYQGFYGTIKEKQDFIDSFFEDLSFHDFLEIYKQNIPFQAFIQTKPELVSKMLSKKESVSIQVYEFLDRNPRYYTQIEKDEVLLKSLFLNIKPSLCMQYLDSLPALEAKVFHNEMILKFILESEQNIFDYLPILNKLGIQNEVTQKYKSGIAKIQEVRPELSIGNSSLRKEMLEEKFIEIIGLDYINIALEYDSGATDILIRLSDEQLKVLHIFLDYLCENISDNRRMIHLYILNSDKVFSIFRDMKLKQEVLTEYEKMILKEIILQGNIYNINTVEELRNYPFMKLKAKKENHVILTENEMGELLFNKSALQNGVPWNLDFNITTYFSSNMDEEYFKYKYVETGLVTEEDYSYLKDAYEIFKMYNEVENKKTLYLEVEALFEKYRGKEIPTARKIREIIFQQENKDFNKHLIDLDAVRKIASYDNPNSEVYIEEQDGIEIIHLNGYDFRSLVHTVGSSSAQSTFSHTLVNDFEQYRIFSEKISYKLQGKPLVGISAAQIILENAENWNRIEGISTLSTSIHTSKCDHRGFGWGKKSDLSILACAGGDGYTSHKIRDLMPSRCTGAPRNQQTLYGNQRCEYRFDRGNSKIKTNNRRVQPEFICDYASKQNKLLAQYFGIPILVKNTKIYNKSYVNTLDKKARHQYKMTLDTEKIYPILYNNKDAIEEKYQFIISTLYEAYRNGQVNLSTFYQKVIEVKWVFYEENFEDYMVKFDHLLQTLGYQNKEKEIEKTESIAL